MKNPGWQFIYFVEKPGTKILSHAQHIYLILRIYIKQLPPKIHLSSKRAGETIRGEEPQNKTIGAPSSSPAFVPLHELKYLPASASSQKYYGLAQFIGSIALLT